MSFKLSPLFLLTYGLLWWCCGGVIATAYILSIIIHELSHVYVADKLGVSTKSVTLSYYGCHAHIPELDRVGIADEIAIICGGPMSNLCIALIFALLSQVLYRWYYPLMDIALWNMYVGAFNLLPLLPLDGGRVLKCVLSLFFGRRSAVKLCSNLSILCGGLAIIFCGYYAFYEQYIVFPGLLGALMIFGGIKERQRLMRSGYNTLSRSRGIDKPKRVRRLALNDDEDLRTVLKYFNEDSYNIVDFIGEDGDIKRTLTEQQIIDKIMK